MNQHRPCSAVRAFRCLLYSIVCVVFAACILPGQSAFAQGSGVVKGRILDKETGDPLPAAIIAIQNTTIGTTADIEGWFTLRNVPVGRQTVKVSYLGYQSVSSEVVIAKDATIEKNFRLAAQAL